MGNRDHCPETAVLVRWNAGALPIEQFETVSDHLEACPTCQQTLDQLEDLSFVIGQQLAGITTTDLERARQAIAADQSTVHAVSSWLSDRQSKYDELFEPALRVPCELREYEIQRLLGHGGMGEVYEARHKRLKRPVALKVMRSTRQNDPLAQAHFLREIETAGQFDHPNLVRAYDAWEQDGYVFLAQELLDGDSLRTLATDGKISGAAEIVDWLIGICLGVEQLHARGFLHRDIKPSNVMRLRDGSIKLIDYGLAISTDLDESSLVNRAGTIGYMAPEQATGVGVIDHRSDLYSVGCVLKYLLRHLPHEDLGEFELQLRGDLARLADQMTSTLPEDRPASISSVRVRLEQFQQRHEAQSRVKTGNSLWIARLLGLIVLTGVVVFTFTIYLPRKQTSSAAPDLTPQPEQVRVESPSTAYKTTRDDISGLLPPKNEIAKDLSSELEMKAAVQETPDEALERGLYWALEIGDWEKGLFYLSRSSDERLRKVSLFDLASAQDPRQSLALGDAWSEIAGEQRESRQYQAYARSREYYLRSSEQPGATGEVAARRVAEVEQHLDRLLKNTITETGVPHLAVAPIDADRARRLQQSWSRHLGLPVDLINSQGIKLKLIPPGTFTMGSAAGEHDEVVHEVMLTTVFFFGVTEVTQEQYERVMGINPARNKEPRHPVEMVSWNDAKEFCHRLSQLPEEKAAGRVYRLPTEAEWEYACRAGTTTEYSFGDDSSKLSDFGWYGVNSDSETQMVGQKKPNAWGLHDMHGNVWEWCEDWYGYFEPNSVTDPMSPESGSTRVFRGGCWKFDATLCRSSDRIGDYPSVGMDVYGFRIAMTDSGVSKAEKMPGTPISK